MTTPSRHQAAEVDRVRGQPRWAPAVQREVARVDLEDHLEHTDEGAQHQAGEHRVQKHRDAGWPQLTSQCPQPDDAGEHEGTEISAGEPDERALGCSAGGGGEHHPHDCRNGEPGRTVT